MVKGPRNNRLYHRKLGSMVQEILGCIIEKLESKVQETGLPTADYAKIGNLM